MCFETTFSVFAKSDWRFGGRVLSPQKARWQHRRHRVKWWICVHIQGQPTFPCSVYSSIFYKDFEQLSHTRTLRITDDVWVSFYLPVRGLSCTASTYTIRGDRWPCSQNNRNSHGPWNNGVNALGWYSRGTRHVMRVSWLANAMIAIVVRHDVIRLSNTHVISRDLWRNDTIVAKNHENAC